MAITLTLKQASEESGLSIRTLYYAIGNGQLCSVQVGRRRLIPRRALEDYLLRGSNPNPKPRAGRESKSRAAPA